MGRRGHLLSESLALSRLQMLADMFIVLVTWLLPAGLASMPGFSYIVSDFPFLLPIFIVMEFLESLIYMKMMQRYKLYFINEVV